MPVVVFADGIPKGQSCAFVGPALTLVAAGPVLAGENPFDNGRGFDWDRYHAGQDACAEKDRIAAQCAYWAICDERALRQAQRVCSAFGPTFPRSPEPPSPPWASPLVGQDRKLGPQNRSLTAADHRAGAGVDEFDQQPVDTLASFLDQLTLDLDLPLGSIRPIALVFDVLAQHLDGL
jgi:hypothetical protein